MRQLIEHLNTGQLELIEVPAPKPGPGQVLVRVERSVISAGTEAMLHEFAQASLLKKVALQPARARQVLDKLITDGPITTFDAVRAKLNAPIPLGYACAGEVVGHGAGVSWPPLGAKVACNGPHAELVAVPATLCALIPEGLSTQDAAIASIGAVALQGVRLLRPQLGERVAVIGLGLLGQLSVQLLAANGCQVFGADLDAARVALAVSQGAHAVQITASDGRALTQLIDAQEDGVDGVLVCVDAPNQPLPMQLAAQISRARGKIVLVGVAGLNLDRAQLYAKELSIQVSCSYGPGRYADDYERLGADYAPSVLRWSAGRNMAAILALLAQGRLSLAPLGLRVIPFEHAHEAYEQRASALITALRYTPQVHITAPEPPRVAFSPPYTDKISALGIIGAGQYATRTLLPAYLSLPERPPITHICSPSGLSAQLAARAVGAQATSEVDEVIGAAALDAVMILTRHDSHAALVIRALEAGKHVFVEKPLGVSFEELDAVQAALDARAATPPRFLVGFNRRFAPLTQQLIAQRPQGPLHLLITINAGALPADHWTLREEQGGRLVGELCHFVDLAQAIVGAPICDASATRLPGHPAQSLSGALRFEDGSAATLHYTSQGARSFAKERVEVFGGERVFVIENWRGLKVYGQRALPGLPALTQEKGHRQMLEAFFSSQPLPPASHFIEVTRWTLRLALDVL